MALARSCSLLGLSCQQPLRQEAEGLGGVRAEARPEGWAGRTLEASVRMSFESLTRHCSGTVTSITFTRSFFRLRSLTNFPYQAFTMMSPVGRGQPQRGSGSVWGYQEGEQEGPPHPPGRPCLCPLTCMYPFTHSESHPPLTHPGLLCFNDSPDRFLHQSHLAEGGQVRATHDTGALPHSSRLLAADLKAYNLGAGSKGSRPGPVSQEVALWSPREAK